MKEWFQQEIVGPIREVDKNHGNKRSSKWNTVRAIYLKMEPECVVCGTKKGLHVHHIQPFHLRPDLELDLDNLITLCRKHHFTFGHLGWWSSWNVAVQEDALHWGFKYECRPSRSK